MIKTLVLGLLSLVLFTFASCKKDPDQPKTSAKEDMLINTPWKLNRVTDVDGKVIDRSRLGVFTDAIYAMSIQFQTNNRVRALNESGQVLNGGTWYLNADETVVDIDVSGFAGAFKLVTLSSNSLTLQQTNVQVDGKAQAANLEFIPGK